MAAGAGGKDALIGKGDVVSDLKRVDDEIARSGTGVTGSTTLSPEFSARARQDILSDPSLGIEEKIQLLLESITESTDNEMLGVMGEMDRLAKQKADLKDPNGKEAQDAARSMEKLQLRLQKLVERRKQMFDLMSNMSEKFNEMAKTAIQNMARA